MSLNCGHHRAYPSSLIWYKSVKGRGGMILTGENRRVGLTTPPWKRLFVTKSEEAIAEYFTWQKLLSKPVTHVGLAQKLLMVVAKNRRTRRKPCFSATCPPKIPSGLTKCANLVLRCERQATNHLSHGTATHCGVAKTSLVSGLFPWCDKTRSGSSSGGC
jgi:hypothetical protein